ncbi:hypothetical protein VTL71DRAFT_2270 [Oculimacula yallundae]|uniref:Histone chaperone domain-containing protein n=1 Tax=Oculimacula yallundae TaxID=86028 RepID=A0ABR4CAE1_9HELO
MPLASCAHSLQTRFQPTLFQTKQPPSTSSLTTSQPNSRTPTPGNQLKMSDQSASANTSAVDKGKGKSVAEPQHDTAMETEDSSSDEEVEVEEDNVAEDQDEEIDPSNIIPSGRRTRGVQIDYAKAAEQMKADGEMEEDSEDDGDFEEPPQDSDSEMKDK